MNSFPQSAGLTDKQSDPLSSSVLAERRRVASCARDSRRLGSHSVDREILRRLGVAIRRGLDGIAMVEDAGTVAFSGDSLRSFFSAVPATANQLELFA